MESASGRAGSIQGRILSPGVSNTGLDSSPKPQSISPGHHFPPPTPGLFSLCSQLSSKTEAGKALGQFLLQVQGKGCLKARTLKGAILLMKNRSISNIASGMPSTQKMAAFALRTSTEPLEKIRWFLTHGNQHLFTFFF